MAKHAILIFEVGDDTTDEDIDHVVAQMAPPPDWTFRWADEADDLPTAERVLRASGAFSGCST